MKAKELKRYSSKIKVLGHLKRLEIASFLQGHSLTVGQISQMTALRQATVSQHLIALKTVDLVVAEKIGKEIYYSLNQKEFVDILELFKNLVREKPIDIAEPTVIDPICDMYLTPSTADYTAEYDGVRHYFCGKGCLKEFRITHKGGL